MDCFPIPFVCFQCGTDQNPCRKCLQTLIYYVVLRGQEEQISMQELCQSFPGRHIGGVSGLIGIRRAYTVEISDCKVVGPTLGELVLPVIRPLLTDFKDLRPQW